MSVIDHLARLRTTAWMTAGSRYNSARRLQRRSRFSLTTISLLSGIGVFAPFVLGEGTGAPQFSAFLSMLVLIVGIMEGASEFSSKAASLFANAEDLNAFQSRLALLDAASVSAEQLQSLDAEYQQIKRRSQLNHEPIDMERFILQHSRSPEFRNSDGSARHGWLRGLAIRAAYESSSIWWLILLWLIALTGLWLVCNGYLPNDLT